jgi:hypothetical protein
MSTLVNSILEKIDEIRVSRDSLRQIINDNMDVDTSGFKLVQCINYVENNILKPTFAIRPKNEDYVETLCPFNVRLTEKSWVSLDFAMNDISLEKDFVYLFGIHENSIRCYTSYGHLYLCTTSEVPMLQEIYLDTNRHTLAFGFTGEVREEDGYARFQIEFDDVVVANDFVEVPTFNLPFSLYDIPHYYDGTYEDYEASGGISYLVNTIGYTQNKSLFDVFALNVYDTVDDERKAVKAYVPGLDGEQKTTFLEKISGEYQYPTGGRYLYVKILGDTTTVITNTVFEKPVPVSYYLKPSEGAIVPTDIKFTTTTQITMYVKGFDNFDEQTDLNDRAMFGAQPNILISPFNNVDVSRGLPFYDESHSMPKEELRDMVSDGRIGLYYWGCSNYFYSTANNFGCVPQIMTIDGEHIIKAGYDVHNPEGFNIDTDQVMNKILSIDGQPDNKRQVGPTPGPIHAHVTNEMKTPLCFFGCYNNVSTTPDEVIALGYQNALNQLGYNTGVRYGVKQIDISVRNADGSTSVTHCLIPATDSDGVNYLKDTITGSSYYPFNGTLDKME